MEEIREPKGRPCVLALAAADLRPEQRTGSSYASYPRIRPNCNAFATLPAWGYTDRVRSCALG